MKLILSDIGIITWCVILILSIYFISSIWIFLWRWIKLGDIENVELESLDILKSNNHTLRKASFYKVLESNNISLNMLNIEKINTINKITIGLSMLSVIASTAPFIGLFGTVVEILEAFYHMGGEGKVSFDIIAPIISKALIATACGIFTSIPAYSFYIILKRKAYIVSTYLDMQINLILDSNIDEKKYSKITLK